MVDKGVTEIRIESADAASEYSVVFDGARSEDLARSIEDVIELRAELDELAELRRATEALAETETHFFTRS